MEPWTGAQRAFAVKAFYKIGDSFVITQREFWIEFGIHHNCAVPSAHAIKTWVRNFDATGSTLKKKGGSVKTVRTPENIAVVREAIERSPHRSARCHSVSLGLSEASVRQILPKDLHFYPYKIQVTHALHEHDYENRVNFCQTFLQLINQNQELVNNLLMSAEADFHLSRFVNTKFLLLVYQKPHRTSWEITSLFQSHSMVCDIFIWNYRSFFEDERERAVTVTGPHYIHML